MKLWPNLSPQTRIRDGSRDRAEAPSVSEQRGTGTHRGIRPENLPALTGARFFAALYVVWFHFSGPVKGFLPKPVRNLVEAGNFSVSFFFVLSGFVLTYNYYDAVRRDTFGKRLFWVSRFARVHPMYVVALLLTAAIQIAGPRFFLIVGDWKSFLLQLFAVHSWLPQFAFSWNFPSWSICCEFFFYAVFPLVASPLLVRLERPWAAIFLAFTAWSLTVIGTLGAYHRYNPDHLSEPAFRLGLFWFEFMIRSPLSRLSEFLIGMAVGRLFLARSARPHSPISAALVWLSLLRLARHHPVHRSLAVLPA